MSYLRQLELVDRPWPILAQLACAATTEEVLYAAVADGDVLAKVRITNRAAAGKTFRLIYSPLGATLDTTMYLAYDEAIAANASVVIDLGIVMVSTDELRFYGSAADLTVTVFGEAA